MPKYEIHISDIRAFKQCRRKWDWASPLRGNLEPDVPYMPFFTGRAIHHCLEFYHSKGIPVLTSLEEFLNYERKQLESLGRLWPDEEAAYEEQVDLLVAMLMHYENWISRFKGDWSDDNLEYVAMETEFSVPLRNEQGNASNRVYLAGRFDGLVRRKDDGSYWLWETKTTRSITELARSLANDEQAGAYMLAAQELYSRPIQGVLYNILRKKAPTHPAVLKNGLSSKNKSVDTTAIQYARDAFAYHRDEFDSNEACREFVIREYSDILEHLVQQGNTFFARIPIYRTPNELRQLQSDLWTVALEMVRPSTPIYPSPSWLNCNFCHFRAPCLMLNAGANTDLLFKHEYRKRDPWQSFEKAEADATED